MMGMCGELRWLAESVMTLDTCSACPSGTCKHVIGITFMPGVTGKAREFSAFVTRRFHNAIEFATTYADHSIGPKEIAEDFGIPREVLGKAGNAVGPGCEDDGRGFFQVFTGPIFETITSPIFGFIDPLHGMTKTAKLC